MSHRDPSAFNSAAPPLHPPSVQEHLAALQAWSASGAFGQLLDVDEPILDALGEVMRTDTAAALDRLYERLAADPALALAFGSNGRMLHARQAQLHYWQLMWTQPFGHAHMQMARAVATTHHTVGVDPGTYVSAYRFVLAELTAALGRRLAHDPGRLATAVVLLQRLVLEDIELVTRVYHLRDREAVDREKSRFEALLGQILPPAVVPRLSNDARVADTVPKCTVLFADLVGFTQLASRQSPEQTVQMLDAVFARLDHATEQAGLEKIKTIGDAYMAAGGLHGDADLAVQAAVQMGKAFVRIVREEAVLQGLPLDLRVGIHCGPVVAGVVGKKRFLYDLWGDTVNFAARMESSGLPGHVQVSEEVFAHLPPDTEAERRERVEVKGVGEVTAWLLAVQ